VSTNSNAALQGPSVLDIARSLVETPCSCEACFEEVNPLKRAAELLLSYGVLQERAMQRLQEDRQALAQRKQDEAVAGTGLMSFKL
jgi:hypothetical protein